MAPAPPRRGHRLKTRVLQAQRRAIKARLRRFFEQRLLRLPTSETGPIKLTQRRIYVFPSQQGVGVLATLLVMLLASINYTLALGYALTFLLAGACVASLFHGFRQLKGVIVRVGHAPAVFCGETARFHLTLDNPDAFERCGLRLGAEEATWVRLALPAHAQVDLALSRATHQRGPLPLGRVLIETRYPLGVVRVWSVLFPAQSVMVYPEPEQDAPAYPNGGVGTGHAGTQAKSTNSDEDFAGFRPYRLGDSPRHVAWKAAARGGHLLTKTYEGAAPASLQLSWAALPLGLDVEKRLSRLTAWVLRAEQEGRSYGLALPGEQIPPGQGPAHRQQVLTALALFQRP